MWKPVGVSVYQSAVAINPICIRKMHAVPRASLGQRLNSFAHPIGQQHIVGGEINNVLTNGMRKPDVESFAVADIMLQWKKQNLRIQLSAFFNDAYTIICARIADCFSDLLVLQPVALC